jgi:hypothetical protein
MPDGAVVPAVEEFERARLAQRTVIVVSGLIEKGDAARLEALMDRPHDIVFDSPGGSFTEGFALGSVITGNLGSQDPSTLGVYVLEGGQCLSACAVAFAMSVDLVHEGVTDSRFIERGARLGFHMPYLPEAKAGQQGTAGDLLNLAYDISGAFNKLLIGGANSPELMEEILKHRGSDSFFELTGDAAAWRLGFTPVASGSLVLPLLSYGLDVDTIGDLCDRLFSGGRIYKSGVDLEFASFHHALDKPVPLLSELVQSSGGHDSFSRPTNASPSCQVRTNQLGAVGLVVWRGQPACWESGEIDVQKWCADKPRRALPITVGLLAETMGCGVDGFDPQTFTQRWQATVKRDVNMRARPTLDAPVVTNLRGGERVKVRACRITDDHQGVWYQVDAGAESGWLSARFIGHGLVR